MTETVVFEPLPRYVVQVAEPIGYGRVHWCFEEAFTERFEAVALAESLARHKEHVRVIDRVPKQEEGNE